MIMFFAAPNLVGLSVSPSEPWLFAATEKISAQVRSVKEDRQAWYQNTSTSHNFYSAIEGVNPNVRVSKENPPRFIHGFPADYDIKIPAERIVEAIAAMEVKPTWIEISLGGNFRLVWVLQQPIPVEDRDFCTAILQEAHDWLKLDLLPGLDRKAFEETSRLYCNGCDWKPTGFGPVPVEKSQAFFVECGKRFRFKGGDDELVPLDLVEKAVKEKYSNFNWPSDFTLDSQGPSFWIPESVSPLSAIVKPGGMFTFAMHASKPFYSWSDLLGKEFSAKFQQDSIAQATFDAWWDGKKFWLKKAGYYVSLDRTELMSYLKVTCRLSAKATKGGISPLDAAIEHIYRHQSVHGAAPFIHVRPGLHIHEGLRKLNTWMGKPMEPAAGKQKWGPQGNFPMLSAYIGQLFSTEEQLAHMRAWQTHFFTGAVNYVPMPGPNTILMGQAGIGKTFLNRHVHGPLAGGFADASNYLVDGSQFNSELIGVPVWCLDDDSPSSSTAAQNRMQSMMKKTAANQQHMCNTKFEKSCMVDWCGRICCTTNLDFVSSRIIGPLDNTSLDKTALFRCNPRPTFVFPPRLEWARTVLVELPFYLRCSLDYSLRTT